MSTDVRRLAARITAACLPGLLLLGPSATVAPALAQGMSLQIVPKIGVFTPIGSLTQDTEMRTGLAYGVAAELLLPRLPVALRAGIDLTAAVDIEERGADGTRVGEVTLMNMVGDIVIRPLPRTAGTQPYFLGGAGIKRYEFDLEADAGELGGVERDASRFTVHIGGGVDIRRGAVAVVLEIGDYISSFVAASGESRLQNDAFGMVGLRVNIF